MPIFFLLVGAVLIFVAINNKMDELGGLIKEDFRPSAGQGPGFHIWILAIFIVGSLGYVKALRPLANAFLVLIITGMILNNRGFIAKFKTGIQG